MNYINQYTQLHSDKPGYGAGKEHFEYILVLMQMISAGSIVDWGCGKGRLADSLTALSIDCAKYDPAIPEYSQVPKREFDAALSTDVLEHIPAEYIAETLREMSKTAASAVVIPHLTLAKTILPDGSNAHCTIKTPGEWHAEFQQFYSIVEVLPHHSDKHAMFWCSNVYNVTPSARALCSHLANQRVSTTKAKHSTCRAQIGKAVRLIAGDKGVKLMKKVHRTLPS